MQKDASADLSRMALVVPYSMMHASSSQTYRFRSCQYVACHQQTPPGTVKDACICLLTFYMLLFSWRIRIAILTQSCIMLWLLWSKSQQVILTSIPNSKARPHLNENCVQLWSHSGLDRCSAAKRHSHWSLHTKWQFKQLSCLARSEAQILKAIMTRTDMDRYGYRPFKLLFTSRKGHSCYRVLYHSDT